MVRVKGPRPTFLLIGDAGRSKVAVPIFTDDRLLAAFVAASGGMDERLTAVPVASKELLADALRSAAWVAGSVMVDPPRATGSIRVVPLDYAIRQAEAGESL